MLFFKIDQTVAGCQSADSPLNIERSLNVQMLISLSVSNASCLFIHSGHYYIIDLDNQINGLFNKPTYSTMDSTLWNDRSPLHLGVLLIYPLLGLLYSSPNDLFERIDCRLSARLLCSSVFWIRSRISLILSIMAFTANSLRFLSIWVPSSKSIDEKSASPKESNK